MQLFNRRQFALEFRRVVVSFWNRTEETIFIYNFVLLDEAELRALQRDSVYCFR